MIAELEAAAICGYMVSIVKYLHKHGVIIRNLRPETILFEDSSAYDMKLVDLSLAISKKHYKDGVDNLFEIY